MISIRNVSKNWGQKQALKDINWEVGEGQRWVILGLNGSGKTTLLKIATGYLWPSSGEVQILGRRTGSVDLRQLRKSIGWASNYLTSRIPQSMENLKVIVAGKHASFGLYEKIGDDDVKKAQELLRLLGAEGVIGQNLSTCSQGEKQKVLIARALMSDPRLLVLDEPCIGLDMKAREDFLKNLEKICEHTCSVIYVTHHIDEIIESFTHALLLKDGVVTGAGPLEKVLTDDNIRDCLDINARVVKDGGRYGIRFER